MGGSPVQQLNRSARCCTWVPALVWAAEGLHSTELSFESWGGKERGPGLRVALGAGVGALALSPACTSGTFFFPQ